MVADIASVPTALDATERIELSSVWDNLLPVRRRLHRNPSLDQFPVNERSVGWPCNLKGKFKKLKNIINTARKELGQEDFLKKR